MLKKKNGKCPFGYVEFNGMCVPENQQSQFQFSNEFTSSNGYQPIPNPKPPTPIPPGPGPSPDNGGKYDDTYKYLHDLAKVTGTVAGVGLAGLEGERRYRKAKIDQYLREQRAATELEASLPARGSTTPNIDFDAMREGNIENYFSRDTTAELNPDQVAINIDYDAIDIDLDGAGLLPDDAPAAVQDYFAAANPDQVAIDIDPFAAQDAAVDAGAALPDWLLEPPRAIQPPPLPAQDTLPDWLADAPNDPFARTAAEDAFPELFRTPQDLLNNDRFLINTDEQVGLDMAPDITMEQLNAMTDQIDELYAQADSLVNVRTAQDGTETEFQRLSRQKMEEEAAETKAAREKRLAREEADAAKAEEEAVAGPKTEYDTLIDELETIVDDAEGAAAAEDPFYGGEGFDVEGDGYGEKDTFGRDYDEIAKTEGELAPDPNYGKPGNSDYGTDYGRTGTATGKNKIAQEAREIEGYTPTDALDQEAYDLFKSQRASSQAPPYQETPIGQALEDEIYADVPSLESLAAGGGGAAPTGGGGLAENPFAGMDMGAFGGEGNALIDGAAPLTTEEAIAQAEKIIAGARIAGAGITAAQEAASIARIAAMAAEGEEIAVASAIMGALTSAGTANIAAVATVGLEIAAMTAVTFGAEAIYKEIAGVKDRPESLGGEAHEMTKEEAEYFKYVAQTKVDKAAGAFADSAVGAPKRRAPINPFDMKAGDGRGGKRPTRQSSARNKALYNEMSDEEKKVFDDNYNKMIADEEYSIAVWNNIPAGTMIENSPDGYKIFQIDKPNENTIAEKRAELAEAQSWIEDFNNSLKDVPVIDDGIGHAEPLDMGETKAYLAMMDQRNTDYLNSISEAQMSLPEMSLPGSNGGGINKSAVLPHTGGRLNLPDFGPPSPSPRGYESAVLPDTGARLNLPDFGPPSPSPRGYKSAVMPYTGGRLNLPDFGPPDFEPPSPSPRGYKSAVLPDTGARLNLPDFDNA
tara:strand:- start:4961 stop:7894 length:2934 start_codon:yes stop_codon:yes gene_type:complete